VVPYFEPTDRCFIRFANIVYEPDAGPLLDMLWNETIAELEFAGVRDILNLKEE
jgi:hypothetical protein